MSSVSGTVAARIRETREAQNLSQEGLARKLGISWVTINRYERGRSRVSLDRLYEIADALEVSVTDLLDEDGEKVA